MPKFCKHGQWLTSMQIPPSKVPSFYLCFTVVMIVYTGDWEAFWLGDPSKLQCDNFVALVWE